MDKRIAAIETLCTCIMSASKGHWETLKSDLKWLPGKIEDWEAREEADRYR